MPHIIITGASSGIGAALAQHYAAPGTQLALYGRDEDRIKHIAALCEGKGAVVQPIMADVTDREAMHESLTLLDNSIPVDLVIANAGISAGTGGGMESEEQSRKIFHVNLDGTLNTVHPLLQSMMQRGRGQIAIMSSLAGFRGLPSCPAYSASKASVRFYGEGLRGVCGKAGVKVSVICPGYIKTPMTEVNKFPMPFIMTAEKAAAIIARGLERNKSRIAFPLPMHIAAWLAGCLSPTLTDPLFAALPAKENAVK